MTREEAVQKLVTGGRLSVAHAEDLYDSIIPKPVVPQYVADWYEKIKEGTNEPIFEYLVNWDDIPWDDFKRWMSLACDTQVITTLVNMHQFGYEVKKEPRYTVKLKNQEENEDYLVKTDQNGYRFYNKIYTDRRIHTRKELEEAGFGWVFNCEGIVIEEVE